jgi:hypothetical protein
MELHRLFPVTPYSGNVTRVGVHHRAGDYNNENHAWRTPWTWYQRWIDENWRQLKNPTLVVAAEDRSKRLKVPTGDVEYLHGTPFEDWTALARCDVLLIPNSTFSFTAAMMNRNLAEAWRASLPDGGFVPFDPWDALPLLDDRAQNYLSTLDSLK